MSAEFGDQRLDDFGQKGCKAVEGLCLVAGETAGCNGYQDRASRRHDALSRIVGHDPLCTTKHAAEMVRA